MKVIPVNNNSLIKFKSLMAENDSDYEIKMKKIFETYLIRDEEIERLFLAIVMKVWLEIL